MNACFDKLKVEGAGYSKEELEAIRNEANRFIAQHMGKMSDAEMQAALKAEIENKEAQAALTKWRKAIDLDKQAEMMLLGRQASGLRKNNPLLGFRALLVEEHGDVEGLRASAFRRGTAYRVKYHDQLFRGVLEREDPVLWKIWTHDTLEADIAEGMMRISNGKTLEGLPANAARIAKQLHVVEREMLRDLNQNAVAAKATEQYAGPNVHDPVRVQKVSKPQFVAWMLERFDMKDMDDAAAKAARFGEAYDHIVSTIHGEPEERFGHVSAAKAQAAGRDFIPKSSQAWLEHTQTFGYGSLRETWTRMMASRARLLGLMETMGYNYRSNLKTVIENFIAHEPMAPEKRRELLQSEWNGMGTGRIEVLLKHVTGEANIPTNATMANVMSWVRTVTRLSILGAAMPAHLNLWATAAADLHYIGWRGAEGHERGYLSNFADVLKAQFAHLGSQERRDFANTWGIATDGLIHSLYTAFDTQGNVQRNINNLYFNVNLMHPFINSVKLAYAAQLGAMHHNWSGLGFDALPKGQQIVFRNHGITPAMWDVIRTAKAEIGDYRIISPEKLRAIDDETIKAYAAKTSDDRKVRTIRDDIATRYTSMMLDRMDVAVAGVTPKTRADLVGNTQPGNLWGDAARSFAMIKTYPVQMWHSLVGRELYGYGMMRARDALLGGHSGYAFAKIFTLSAALGYISLTIKELAAGKTAPDPMSGDTWMKSMIRGGALGLYGDFLLSAAGDTKKKGIDTLGYLAGPLFGKASEMLDLLHDVMSVPIADQPEKPGARIFRSLYHDVPLNNLLGVRLALDNLIYYNIMEEMNPGYLHRTQRNLERSTGQHYWNMPH